ncbi:hypothetical protein HLB44_08765 [Aquincola sp. S2]|uniref:Glycine zipper domain-containing protein n=1 Tax=Pseudaquabacterium terrae TaxID=2732868 RepID=A0ABX2EEL9_9BURK|nr:hypothetical protein [Aquabacterium terrae]NRF67070.1 hypothetical protein [Aquabacterium terrae]
MTNQWPQRASCIALAVVMALGGAGCKTSPRQAEQTGGPPLTANEQRMREDEERARKSVIEAVIVSAALGAAACGLIAKATGGSRTNVRNSAIACAAGAGALVGADAYREEKLRKHNRNEIAAIQSTADDVKADNRDMQAYLDSSGRVLADGQQRLASMKADLAAKRITVADADAARRREENNIASMNETLKQAKTTRDDYKQAAAKFQGTGPARKNLDDEIAAMDRQVAQLERNIREYNRALAVSRA